MTDLPPVIEQYQRAHDRRDTTAAIAAFDPDATVIDGRPDVRRHRRGALVALHGSE